MKGTVRNLCLLAAAVFSPACGGDDNSDDGVECTASVDCAERTDGKTECNLASNTCVTPSVVCNTSADCAGRDDGKTDCDPTKHVCTFPDGFCLLPEDCESQLCGENNTCLTTKKDVCTKRTEEELDALNASSQDETALSEYKFTDLGDGTFGWTTEERCPISLCKTGYTLESTTGVCNLDEEIEEKTCSAENMNCGDDEMFCRQTDNGESADPRYTYICEFKASQQTEPSIVISQVYLGGLKDSDTAVYANSFVELYNFGSSEVDLSNLRLYQATAKGNIAKLSLDFSTACDGQPCKIPSQSYFVLLNKNANTAAGTQAAEVPNAIQFSTTLGENGALAVTVGEIPGSSEKTCANLKKIAVDLIGMGSAACSETQAAQGISTETSESGQQTEGNRGTHSYQRTNNADTGNNLSDFSVVPVALH